MAFQRDLEFKPTCTDIYQSPEIVDTQAREVEINLGDNDLILGKFRI